MKPSLARNKKYSPDDIKFIQQMYGLLPARELAALMGHPTGSISNTAWKLGIKSQMLWRNNPDYKWSEAETAYLAGIIDGEGSIHFSKTGLGYLHFGIYIQMNHRGVMEYLAKLLKVKLQQPKPRGNQQISYKIDIRGILRILKVLEKVLPFLIVKKEKAQILIDFCQSRLEKAGKVNTPYSQHELNLVELSKQYNSGKGGSHT